MTIRHCHHLHCENRISEINIICTVIVQAKINPYTHEGVQNTTDMQNMAFTINGNIHLPNCLVCLV